MIYIQIEDCISHAKWGIDKMRINRNMFENKRWVDLAIALCIAAAFFLGLSHISVLAGAIKKVFHYISPVLIAVAIAYVMDPLVNLFQDKILTKVKNETLRRNLALILTLILVIVILVLLIWRLVPQLVDSVITFVSNLGAYANSLQKLLEELAEVAAAHNIDLSGIVSSSGNLLDQIVELVPAVSGSSIVNTSFHVGRNVVNGLIAFILAIYFLADKKRLRNGFKRMVRSILPDHAYKVGSRFWTRCNSILLRFIIFDLIDGVIVGVINAIFMSIAGMPYIAIISTIVGVTNLAPTFGPIVGGIIGAFILVLVNPWHALWFLIFTIALQTVDGYFIKPKLFGNQLGVPAVWILVAIVVGGRMFGVIGIVLGIPVAAILDFTYHENILPWLEKKRRLDPKDIGIDDE